MKNNILDFFKNKKIISFILNLMIFTSIILQKVIPSYSFISILLFIIINSFVYFQIQNNKTKYSRDLIIISLCFGTPVFIEYFKTGLVPRIPTLVFAGFMLMISILMFTCGIILEVIVKKHRQLFELLYISTKR